MEILNQILFMCIVLFSLLGIVALTLYICDMCESQEFQNIDRKYKKKDN